jgi:hypothetical protein
VFPLNLYARVHFVFVQSARETAGAARTRSSLRPLILGRNDLQNFGRIAPREGGRICLGSLNIESENTTSVSRTQRTTMQGHRAALHPGHETDYTGSAIEYFTWLSAKLDSIEAIPSSRVSLFFRNAS